MKRFDLRRAFGGGGNSVKPSGDEVLDVLFLSSSPQRGGEFADGRRESSPDSEQIEYTVAKQHVRNSVSVEQIQDSERSHYW